METNKVDMVNINRIIKTLELIPERVCLRFQTKNGMPGIKLLLTHENGTREEISTLANASLIDAIRKAMLFDMEPLKEFQECGDKEVTEERENFELDMFKEYIASTLPMTIREDFITNKGDRYAQVVFSTLNPQSVIYFCVKHTEEVENLLYERKSK